jgi:hypothetical protein
MNTIFIRGLLYGFAIAVIIGFVWGQVSKARKTIGQRNQTLDKFSEASRSKLTPARIVLDSTLAVFKCVFWLLILIAFIVLMVGIIQWELIGR